MFEEKKVDRLTIISTIFFAAVFFSAEAQVDPQSDLYRELSAKDSLLFELGFNRCEAEIFNDLISEDLIFFHDQSGTQNKAGFLESTKKYICSGSGPKPIRKLEASSLEVYPLYNNGSLYGAIQKGVHHFYLREEGKEDVWTSSAKFTHVWMLEGNSWKINKVLSYDHQNPEKAKPTTGIETLLEKSNVPALGLGIIENGTLTKVDVYGTLDKETVAPYNTIFKVASLTKPLAAIIALKLIDQGLLGMDEPLYQYWVDPDLGDDPRVQLLTPKLVLTHQTGFPNWRYLTEENKLTFQHEPGTVYQYSGEGFEYLRKAIEQKTNKSFEELARELVFSPLGMTDTHFWWEESMDETRYAQNFNEKGEQLKTVKYYEANAAANLLTTVRDYGTFLAYVINGAGISESLYQAMINPQVKLKEQDFFGLGWEILTGFSNGEEALVHSGADPGVSTLALWFPKSKNGYVIFLNGDNSMEVYEELLTKRLYKGNELWERR